MNDPTTPGETEGPDPIDLAWVDLLSTNERQALRDRLGPFPDDFDRMTPEQFDRFCDRIGFSERIRKAQAESEGTRDAAPGLRGYVLDYDEQHGWLVMSDPEGAAQIVARDVRSTDAAYLIAGYDALAEKAATPPSEAPSGEIEGPEQREKDIREWATNHQVDPDALPCDNPDHDDIRYLIARLRAIEGTRDAAPGLREQITAAWPKNDAGRDMALWHPDELLVALAPPSEDPSGETP